MTHPDACPHCEQIHTDHEANQILDQVLASVAHLDRVEAATVLRRVIDELRETL